MTFPLHRGRTQLHLVITTNDTYAEGSLGHSRSEWFPTLLSAAVGMPADAARVCGDSAGKEGPLTRACGVYRLADCVLSLYFSTNLYTTTTTYY